MSALASIFFLSFGSSFLLQAQVAPAGSNSWTGVIINDTCTPDEAFSENPKCTDKIPGTKLKLFDDNTRQIFDLDPSDKAVGHLGDYVTVRGRLEASLIHISSFEPRLSVGLPVGQKAPAFSLQDQFGHTQTLDSVKGPRGTVLLFFRSADW